MWPWLWTNDLDIQKWPTSCNLSFHCCATTYISKMMSIGQGFKQTDRNADSCEQKHYRDALTNSHICWWYCKFPYFTSGVGAPAGKPFWYFSWSGNVSGSNRFGCFCGNQKPKPLSEVSERKWASFQTSRLGPIERGAWRFCWFFVVLSVAYAMGRPKRQLLARHPCGVCRYESIDNCICQVLTV